MIESLVEEVVHVRRPALFVHDVGGKEAVGLEVRCFLVRLVLDVLGGAWSECKEETHPVTAYEANPLFGGNALKLISVGCLPTAYLELGLEYRNSHGRRQPRKGLTRSVVVKTIRAKKNNSA